MYTMFKTPQPSSRLGVWRNPVGKFREVLGYTALGSVFLRNPDDGMCIVLYPLRAGNNAGGVGKFANAQEFERSLLGDAEVRKELLQPDLVAQVQARLGPLGPEQVYFPVPYPMLGGSGAASTYDKGDLWTFLDLVGQTRGLGESPAPSINAKRGTNPAAPEKAKADWKRSPNVWTLIVIAIGLVIATIIRYS